MENLSRDGVEISSNVIFPKLKTTALGINAADVAIRINPYHKHDNATIASEVRRCELCSAYIVASYSQCIVCDKSVDTSTMPTIQHVTIPGNTNTEAFNGGSNELVVLLVDSVLYESNPNLIALLLDKLEQCSELSTPFSERLISIALFDTSLRIVRLAGRTGHSPLQCDVVSKGDLADDAIPCLDKQMMSGAYVTPIATLLSPAQPGQTSLCDLLTQCQRDVCAGQNASTSSHLLVGGDRGADPDHLLCLLTTYVLALRRSLSTIGHTKVIAFTQRDLIAMGYGTLSHHSAIRHQLGYHHITWHSVCIGLRMMNIEGLCKVGHCVWVEGQWSRDSDGVLGNVRQWLLTGGTGSGEEVPPSTTQGVHRHPISSVTISHSSIIGGVEVLLDHHHHPHHSIPAKPTTSSRSTSSGDNHNHHRVCHVYTSSSSSGDDGEEGCRVIHLRCRLSSTSSSGNNKAWSSLWSSKSSNHTTTSSNGDGIVSSSLPLSQVIIFQVEIETTSSNSLLHIYTLCLSLGNTTSSVMNVPFYTHSLLHSVISHYHRDCEQLYDQCLKEVYAHTMHTTTTTTPSNNANSSSNTKSNSSGKVKTTTSSGGSGSLWRRLRGNTNTTTSSTAKMKTKHINSTSSSQQEQERYHTFISLLHHHTKLLREKYIVSLDTLTRDMLHIIVTLHSDTTSTSSIEYVLRHCYYLSRVSLLLDGVCRSDHLAYIRRESLLHHSDCGDGYGVYPQAILYLLATRDTSSNASVSSKVVKVKLRYIDTTLILCIPHTVSIVSIADTVFIYHNNTPTTTSTMLDSIVREVRSHPHYLTKTIVTIYGGNDPQLRQLTAQLPPLTLCSDTMSMIGCIEDGDSGSSSSGGVRGLYDHLCAILGMARGDDNSSSSGGGMVVTDKMCAEALSKVLSQHPSGGGNSNAMGMPMPISQQMAYSQYVRLIHPTTATTSSNVNITSAKMPGATAAGHGSNGNHMV